MARTAASQPPPPRQIETRARNKLAHPGNVLKSAVPRRTSDEVQDERDAKAKAKADREAAKRKSILRTAEFEQADIANEDIVDATPRPPFTPKPWPPRAHNHKSTSLGPITESSDVEMGDDIDRESFAPAPSEQSTTENDSDSAIESDDRTPPAKKQKAQGAEKIKAGAKQASGKAAEKKKTQATEKATGNAAAKAAKKMEVDRDEEIVPASDEETPKPKKAKVRDEINIAAKKIVETEVRENRGGDMVNSMSSKQSEGRPGGKPAPEVTTQLQVPVGGRKLKREGAMADVTATSYKKPADKDAIMINDVMEIDDSDVASNRKRKHLSAVNEWASAIPRNASKITSSTSQASKLTTSSRAKYNIPPLTTGSSRSSAPSVLSDKVKVISHQSSDLIQVKAEPAPNALNDYDGGLSDSDEIRGEEREAAINSPPKGKKRITSEKLVIQKKTGETVAPKKPRNEELPEWIDAHWFRHTFVTTYMAFVGQTADPWDVPVKQSLMVMQKIWDATNNHDYEIATSTALYQKTVQRLADSWRNVIGSNGITVLMAFFDAKPEMRDSDSARVEFATCYLEDLRFLYKDSDHDDKKKWKGLFRNPFVVRTFAAHLGAIEGSVKVPGLHDLDKRTPAMVGGLGLAAASVERALTLVANEILTIQVARASKGKPISIPRTANLSSGKESMRQTGFSEVAWGKATRGYAKSAASLTKLKFDFIVQDAEESMKPIRARNKTTATISIDDDDDERAHLVDNSDESDVECMLLSRFRCTLLTTR
ncbi:hypothetical protein JOM56_000793 [Amanita muscaria]